MNILRNRAKEHFPSVLLTLLSIVQALALELLWSHLQENNYPLEWSLASMIVWIQIFATVLGLILIWVVYASNAMRFRWVPATSDSVYPFFIGLMEFLLIDSLGPGGQGLWLVYMAVIFGIMVWVSHQTMRRARQDGSNDAFFRKSSPARLHDFIPPICSVAAMLVGGIYLHSSGDQGLPALLLLLGTLLILCWQMVSLARFWESSVADETET